MATGSSSSISTASVERGHDAQSFGRSATRPIGSTFAAQCGALQDYDELVASAGAARRDQGRDLVEDCSPVWRASVPTWHRLSTSSRTSKRAITPMALDARHAVLASYRHEFRFITTSRVESRRLRELGLDCGN